MPVAAVVLLLVVPAWVIRARGMARLREVRARQAAAGFPLDLEDLFAGLPAVDRSRQAAWEEIGSPFEWEYLEGMGAWDSRVDRWLVGAEGLPAAELQAFLDRERAPMAKAAALLGEGPVHFGIAGYADRTLPRVPGRWRQFLGGVFPMPTSTGRFLRWFRLEALSAADPGPSIAAMDRLVDGCRRPCLEVEAILGITVADLRDRAYANLALAGRLPPGDEERWLREEAEHDLWVADGMRGSRVLLYGEIAREMLEGTFDRIAYAEFLTTDFMGSPGSWFEVRRQAVDTWLHGVDGCALVIEASAGIETALRAGEVPFQGGGVGELGKEEPILAEASRSIWHPVLRLAVQARGLHRMARVFVRILRLREERGRLPADEAELREWLGEHARLLDPGRLDQRILYSRPSPGVVRLEPDRRGPLPPILEGISPELLEPDDDEVGPIRWSMKGGIEVPVPPPDSAPAGGK